MFCSKCGNKLEPNSRFCPICGNQIQDKQVSAPIQDATSYQQPNYQYQQNIYPNYQKVPSYQQPENNQVNKPPKKNNNAILIIIIIISLGVLGFGLVKIFSGNDNNNVPEKARTLMVYMTGSDLESKAGYATNELSAIIPTNVDLENTNVVIMAGGSFTWHNSYVNKNETAIFELTNDGLKKAYAYNVRNMGDAALFSDFLTYAYKNYKAKEYDLVMWNHGAGAFGSNSDELTNDSLDTTELQKGLKNSPFNSQNKLDYILYIACMSGNIENAIIWSDYAEYMIGTEEAAYLVNDNIKLLSEASTDETAITTGTNFINAYQQGMKDLVNRGTRFEGYTTGNAAYKSQTYSLIDLSKIKELKTTIGDFFTDINVQQNYSQIARVRSNIKQYGGSEKSFDMVDIYTIVNNLKSLSPTKADKVLNLIKETVKHNFSGNNYSYGLSIYFPYYAASNIIDMGMQLRVTISTGDQYNTFLSQFLNIKNGTKTLTWAFEENSSSLTSSIKVNSEFGFYLTAEEAKNYANANYQVFRKFGDNYIPVYSSSNVEFDEDKNYLKVKYINKGLKINNEIRNIYMKEISKDEDSVIYEIPIKLYSNDTEFVEAVITYAIDEKSPKGYINSITYKSGNDKNGIPLPNTALVDLSKYKYIEFTNTAYNITKDNKYIESWEKVEDIESTKLETENLHIELADLADEYDYVAVIQVYDVYGNGHYTPLIKIKN